MKIFNLSVVAFWLTIFGLATAPTNSQMVDWHDAVIYGINDTFANHVDVSPADDEGKAISLNSSSATHFYLRYTFFTLLFFMASLNLAFKAGRRDFHRWGGVALAKWVEWREFIIRRQKRRDNAPSQLPKEFEL